MSFKKSKDNNEIYEDCGVVNELFNSIINEKIEKSKRRQRVIIRKTEYEPIFNKNDVVESKQETEIGIETETEANEKPPCAIL